MDIKSKILKSIGALLLSVISSELTLMILLGDSVEGIVALILVFLVAIPFFVLFFWLFSTKGNNNEKVTSFSSNENTSNSRLFQTSNVKKVYENDLTTSQYNGFYFNEKDLKKQRPMIDEIHQIINTILDCEDRKFINLECKKIISDFVSNEKISKKTDLLALGLELSLEELAKANKNEKMTLGANCITTFIFYRCFLDCVLALDEDIIYIQEYYVLFSVTKRISSKMHPYIQMMIKIYDLLDRGIAYLYKNSNNISVDYFSKVSEKIQLMLDAYKDDNTDWNKINNNIQNSLFDRLVSLTVALPSIFSAESDEVVYITKNRFTLCDAIVFVECFIRANVLEIVQSQEIAQNFSDRYIEAVISETIDFDSDAKNFFVDMFYNRATVYDNIFVNSKEPVKDIITVLSHIIHEESDKDEYVTVKDKNHRYFGGITENLAVFAELCDLCVCVHEWTADIIKELGEELKQ